MTPSVSTIDSPCHATATRKSRKVCSPLHFVPVTAEVMPQLMPLLERETGRTCDFTYGGLLMWVELFHYEMCIYADTLFIKGRQENDLTHTAFSLPVGALPIERSVTLLHEYCREHRLPLRFSAVPQGALPLFDEFSPKRVGSLPDWADYLYDADRLATLSGKPMAKKRNHVNQFIKLFGEDCFEPITLANISDIEDFMTRLEATPAPDASAAIERRLARGILPLLCKPGVPLLGGLLRVAGKPIAFTVGEIKGDTLHIHIEKALRDVPGAYEMINKSFAAYILSLYPGVRYINRQDDAGEEGLRRAKQSYHPVTLLMKYNIEL